MIHVPQTINLKRAAKKLLNIACHSRAEPYDFQTIKCNKIDSNYSRNVYKIRTFCISIIASKPYGSVRLWQAVFKSLFGALFTFIVWGTWITNLEPLKWDGFAMTQWMQQSKKQSFFPAAIFWHKMKKKKVDVTRIFCLVIKLKALQRKNTRKIENKSNFELSTFESIFSPQFLSGSVIPIL